MRSIFMTTTVMMGCWLASGGCKDGSGGGGATEARKVAPWSAKTLGKLGLGAEVPGGAEVADTSADVPSAEISAEECSVNVTAVTEGDAADFEAAKASIKRRANKLKQFNKEEKTATGWHLEYEDASMMDDSPLFVVQIRTTIDGKSYDCGRSEREAAKVACVVKVCQSLKKQ